MSAQPSKNDSTFAEEMSFNQPREDSPDQVATTQRFWGKYDGIVVNPIDPEQRGRLQVTVVDVFGPNITSWCVPCLPYAGLSMGMHVVPPIGANVWVEFRHGNPDEPIWTGFWYGEKLSVPVISNQCVPGAPVLAIESFAKHALVISDTPVMPFLPKGGILLKSGLSYIAIEPTGVRIFGIPPQGVQINGTPEGAPANAGLHVM